MSVHLEVVNAVSFVSIHKEALFVDVKKVFDWTLMKEGA